MFVTPAKAGVHDPPKALDSGPGLLSARVTFFRRNDVHETIRPLYGTLIFSARLEACTTMLARGAARFN